MRILTEEAITFDDVTMVPNYSTIKSRKDPDVSSAGLDIPIIAAPMNTVCEYRMARKLNELGGVGVIHRYMTIENQLNQLWDFWDTDKSKEDLPFFAIGATGDFLERAAELYKNDVRKFCIDVASGDSESCVNAVSALRKIAPDAIIMAGNVCTKEGYERLAEAGTNWIRVGVGSGAMCKTRVVTGHGVPQITALMWAAKAKEKYPNTVLISDGGTRTSGDIVKALSIADIVMLGSLLAGTEEAPGEIIKKPSPSRLSVRSFKLYAGMASEDGRSLNSWFDRSKTAFVPEGESVMLPYKGPVKAVLDNLVGGLKVGMSYAGALDLKQLKEKATFIKITPNGVVEGTPHGKK